MHIFLFILLSAVPQWKLNTSISYVYNTCSDGNNGVWCASSGGVFHYSEDSGIGTVYSCPGDLPIPDCCDVISDSRDRLWIATRGSGVVMKDGNIWTRYSRFEGIPGSGRVNALLESSGYIWAGCNGGLARGDENGFVPIPSSAFSPNNVYSMGERNDTLWLCTSKGIYSLPAANSPFSADSWIHWNETQNLQLNRIRIGQQSIYACGGSGAIELLPDSNFFQHIIDYSLVPDSVIVDIRETSHGLLAAGRGVILHRDRANWEKLGIRLPVTRWPTAIFEVSGSVYTSFSYNEYIKNIENTQTGLGFFRLNDDSWEHIPIPGIQCKRIHQMASTKDGRIYAGTYARGVQAYYPGHGWRSFVEYDGMPNSTQTFAVGIDPAGGVWASSYHHGLSWIGENDTYESSDDTVLTFVKDSLAWHSPEATILYEDKLPNNQPVMITAQSNGMWVAFRQFDSAGNPGESSGILGFNGNPMGTMNWAPRLLNDGISSANIRSVYPASQDSLWIAFEAGAGCQLLVHSGNPADDSQDSWYPGSGSAYTTSSGLPSNEVFCFLKVPDIGLIAGTAEGLAVWTGSGFTPYMDISGQIKSISIDLQGHIWCLGEAGVYRISDDQVTVFDHVNSDFVPSPLYQWEYSTVDKVTGGVYFSSLQGLWLVTQEGNAIPPVEHISFYPQPYISNGGLLKLYGPDNDSPVSVDFFSLDGAHIGVVKASSISSWVWDGFLDGRIVASGVYMVLVTINDNVYQTRISVVQ